MIPYQLTNRLISTPQGTRVFYLLCAAIFIVLAFGCLAFALAPDQPASVHHCVQAHACTTR